MSAVLSKIVRHPHLSEEVSAELERRIRSGEYGVGQQLPTGKALSETFEVSRAVVREAVARLKAEGLVETRRGSGAYVTGAPKALNFKVPGVDSADMAHIFELRALIEMTVTELAARRRSEDDLAAMGQCLAAMDDALANGDDGSQADDGFHNAIAAATGNPHVQRLVEFLGQHFSESRRLAWDGASREAARPDEAQREHKLLYQAIAAGDPERARRLAHDHLYAAAARLGLELASDLKSEIPLAPFGGKGALKTA